MSADAPAPLSSEEIAELRRMMRAMPPWSPEQKADEPSHEDAEFAAAARVALPWLLDFADSARTLLQKLELAPGGCPSCRAPSTVRHLPGCELAELLRGSKK